ncbi:plasmid replication protein RepC [Leisingera sp. ANG-Vp]|uniref:plasmid replication protein RepC n=1 Tax=Leisingera sp. ANG-Vp TaxID=1577896 RepID=UPI00057D55D6|nr:plasmid replication protein RepC [Leisingera sp. ANG-Vp]KIC14335.1 replication initiator RepC [Leisingera sp. ANG-Vp]
MTFTKPSTHAACPGAAYNVDQSPETADIWAVFRALRDARSHFGLRPAHLQTLQAMLSCLKPGHGETVFASNTELCRRTGGIDERTLRRHISRFIQLGFMTRHESSNRKRYRIRAANGDCISFGLCLSPMFKRASEFLEIAQMLEDTRRDCLFLRKQILALLAQIDAADPNSTFSDGIRKTLRRKLTIVEYRFLQREVEAAHHATSTVMDMDETPVLPANDGQIVRHHSKSKKESKDLDRPQEDNKPNVRLLTAVCKEATSFAETDLLTWEDVEQHAKTLAPMMGIHPITFDKAKDAVGAWKASSAVFIILQFGSRIRDFAAYFSSVTLGRRETQFNPPALLAQLARAESRLA